MQFSFPPYLRSCSYQPVDLVTMSPFGERYTLSDRNCGKHDREEKHVDGRKRPLVRPRRKCGVIYMWIQKKSGRKTWSEFLWFRIGKDVGCYEHDNGISGSPI